MAHSVARSVAHPVAAEFRSLVGDAQPHAPVYSHGAMRKRAFGAGTCDEVLDLDPWLRERDGRPTVGGIVMLADSVTGWATAASLPAHLAMVTAQIRVELFATPGPEVERIESHATCLHVDDDVGFSRADLSVDGVPIGVATMRSAHLLRGAPRDLGPGPWPMPDGRVDDVLDTTVVTASAESAVVHARAPLALANGTGNVHGGVIAMIAERAMVALAARIEGGDRLRLLDIDVAFPRPLDADDSVVVATAEVATAGRRFLQIAANVSRPGARPSVVVRATYARQPTT